MAYEKPKFTGLQSELDQTVLSGKDPLIISVHLTKQGLKIGIMDQFQDFLDQSEDKAEIACGIVEALRDSLNRAIGVQ